MSRLDKLRIRGVRSFSPENTGVIEFFSPLTIIVGHNGAGKTTIIECLRQACTGELPPNVRSGQAWIHDPKVGGASETKAQILLRIRDTSGECFLIRRSFELFIQSSKPQFRTLDVTTESLDLEGNKVRESHKVADADELVPHKLGVTKAVLDSVVFVHQEESNWPLGELKAVKARFEAIFESSKYVKAMETIRKLKTEKTSELKHLRLEVDHLTTKVNIVEGIRKEIEAGEAEVAETRGRIRELDAQAEGKRLKVEELRGKVDKFKESASGLTTLQAQLDLVKRRNEELYDAMQTEIEDGLEDLLKWRDQFEKKLPSISGDIARKESQLAERKQHLENAQQSLMAMTGRHSAAEAEAAACKREESALVELLRESCLGHGVPCRVNAGHLDSRALESAMEGLKSKLEKLQHDQDREAAAASAEATRLEGDVEEAQAALTKNRQAQILKREEIERLEAKGGELTAKLRKWETEVALVEDLAAKESQAELEMKLAQQAMEEGNFDSRVQQVEMDLHAAMLRGSALKRERGTLQAVAEDQIILAEKQREVKRKQAEADALCERHSPRLASILGTAPKSLPAPAALPALVAETLQAQACRVDAEQTAATKAVAAKAAALNTLGLVQQRVDSLSKEIATQEEGGGSFSPALLQAAKDELDARRGELGQLEAVERMTRRYLEHANADAQCALCEGLLGNGSMSLETFKAKHQEVLEQAPMKRRSVTERLRRAQERYEATLQASPDAATREKMQRELDSVKWDLTEAKQRAKEAAEAAAASSRDLQAAKDKLDILEDLQKELCWPLSGLKKEIEGLQASAPKAGPSTAASDRTLHQVEAEISEAEANESALRKTKESLLQMQSSTRERALAAERKWRDTREASLRARDASLTREGIQTSLEANKKEAAAVRDSLNELIGQSPALESACKAALASRDNARQAATLASQAGDKRVRALADALKSLQDMGKSLARWIMGEQVRELQMLEAELSNSETKKLTLEKDAGALEGDLKDLRDVYAQQEGIRRNINDNIAFRKGKEEEEGLVKKMAEMAELAQRRAEQDELVEELHAEEEELDRLAQQKNILRGSCMSVQDRVREHQKKLKSAAHKGVEEDHKEKVAEVVVHENVIADLDGYHKAIDKALVEYHEDRMGAVNGTIKELWKKVYQGTDIDYIFIRATSEGSRGSYNYRVMMVTGGAELDMRGRCSAGQKVLACIIIRLALSETFCAHCGILCLDEPTTNVDSDNAVALAGCLQELISLRTTAGQAGGFQLVVITHDERFAQLLGKKEYCEHYYLVSKVEYHSEILRQEVLE